MADEDKGGQPPVIPPEVKQKIGAEAVELYKTTLPKVPEKYEGLKLPDKSMLPAETVERTAAIARELGLTDAKHVQRVIDFVGEQTNGLANRVSEEHKTRVKEWEEAALKADDLGKGKPEILQAHVARIGRVVQRFFPNGVKKLLDETGLGSHPDFIRGLSKIGDLAKEDTVESGSPGGGTKKSAADKIYGTGSETKLRDGG